MTKTAAVANGKSRLSNGPIESLNRKVKDLKRLGIGFKDFEQFRNRYLYAVRKNPELNVASDKAKTIFTQDNE